MSEITYIAVGDRMVPSDLTTLPVGTVIASELTSPHRYVRLENGHYQEVGTVREHGWDVFGSNYVVISYPDNVVIRPMTATDYKWKFRNITLKAAHSHSVSVDAVVAALNEMGAGIGDLPLSVDLTLANLEDVTALPDGSLVRIGSPERFGSFGLFQIHGGQARQVLGAQRNIRREGATIASLPDGYVPPVVNESQAALDAFKVKAYVIGLKVKGAQDWCSTYEAIVDPLGISAAKIRPLVTGHELVGTKVNAEGAAALPVGSVLSWQNEAHTACSWFVRVEQAGNKAGTQRIFAHADEGVTGRPGHFSNSMTVAHVPLSEPRVAGMEVLAEINGLNVVAHWDYLPPGTVISWRATQFYLMHRDQRASQVRYQPGMQPRVQEHGQYNSGSFGSPEDLRVLCFPAVQPTTTPEVSDDNPF